MTYAVADYQHLNAQWESLRQALIELQVTLSPGDIGTACSFWESQRGCYLFCATQLILLLIQKEAEGGSMFDTASGENLGVVSTCPPECLSVDDCKALFLAFAVHFPANEHAAVSITTRLAPLEINSQRF